VADAANLLSGPDREVGLWHDQ